MCKIRGRMSPVKQYPLSAIVLTFNSERTLADVLRSLNWCEEILIVDSGSTDRTLLIAEAHGARVIERKFNGFGEQKNSGVEAAKFDWVFVVDSDEVVSEQLREEIQNRFNVGHQQVSGYWIPIQLVFLGKKLRFSGSIKNVLRLFNRQQGRYNQALVHEMLEFTGRARNLHSSLLHYSYLTLEDYFTKFNRYTTFGAEELIRSGKIPSSLKIWISFPAHFLKMYWFKLGFLDGYHGYLWCTFSSISPIVKYAKYKELRQEQLNHQHGNKMKEETA